MKTDDLIAALAREPAASPLASGRIGLFVIGSVLLCAALFLVLIGLRPGLGLVLTTPLLAAKTLLPALLSGAALLAVLRLMRPEGAEAGRARGLLWAGPVAAGLLYAVGFATQPPALWFADVSLVAVAECLGFIILIALPALALSLALVRRGASTAPTRSGALLGLAVSAGAAAGYSLYCTQDNPVFFVTWYGMAILIVTSLGAIAGSRLLRW